MAFIVDGIVTSQSAVTATMTEPMYLVADGTVRTPAPIGGPFQLVDSANGHIVTSGDYLGKWHIMYFGYTFCPDVCPTELSHIVQALTLMGKTGLSITPIFITVDPKRDTPAAMARYVSLFSPRLVGLTGDQENIDQLVSEYNVYVVMDTGEDSSNGYDVGHSAFIYLMNPQGKLAAIYPPNTPPAVLARLWLRAMGQDGT